MAVVGWAVTMAGAAAAQQLARFDPYDSDSCQVGFMSCVSSHSQAAAEWPVVCRKPLLTVDCGKEVSVRPCEDSYSNLRKCTAIVYNNLRKCTAIVHRELCTAIVYSNLRT